MPPHAQLAQPRADTLGLMKILHVYSGNLFGGVERMLISVAELEDIGQEHSFALAFEGRLSQALRKAGASVERLPAVRVKRPLSILRARSALARLLRDKRFDAVICHGIWSYCIFVPSVVAARQAPILYLHDPPDPWGLYYRWAWLTRPALCIANSAHIGRLAKRLRPRARVEVIHPLVPRPSAPPPEAMLSLRARFGSGGRDVVILQASRLERWKGHRNLLKALAELRASPDWVCWIAGAPQRPKEEEYQRELIELAEELHIAERVKFIGHRDDMGTVLAACDVYCQANETPEPFGMVFVEALYAGKPVVGSASGGTLEIITPACGILCDLARDLLAPALERLINDSRLRCEMSERGPARADELCGGTRFLARLHEVVAATNLP